MGRVEGSGWCQKKVLPGKIAKNWQTTWGGGRGERQNSKVLMQWNNPVKYACIERMRMFYRYRYHKKNRNIYHDSRYFHLTTHSSTPSNSRTRFVSLTIGAEILCVIASLQVMYNYYVIHLYCFPSICNEA